MASLLKKFLDKLFRNKEKSSNSTDLLRESWEFEPQDHEKYENWVNSPGFKNLMTLVESSYASFKTSEEYHDGLTFLDSEHSIGLAIHIPDLDIDIEQAKYLSYYFASILMENKYYKSLADVRSRNKNENLLKHYRIYLKPSRKMRDEKPYEQLFGNVIIETLSVNDTFKQLKLQSNFYSDSKFKDPHGMDDFIGLLTD